MQFELVSKFKPTGDQPQAIRTLTENIQSGSKHQVLLGVTGSGKTFTLANTIANIQRPVLIVEPNKTLAAQVYQELKEFFPNNAVHYFVSYYDYYQPEAYVPQTDTYIEKDAKINEVLDRLRHAAAQEVLTRKDAVVVASVSCIYNIGSPEEYQRVALEISEGQTLSRKALLSHLTSLQYQRNDIDFTPGTFRVRGEIVEVYPATGTEIIQIELDQESIRSITSRPHLLDRESEKKEIRHTIFPAKFWVTPQDKLNIAMENIRLELKERLEELKKQSKLLEAERLEQRANYDLEMIQEAGYCHGIENYSRHFEFRKPGEPPFTLIDYFGKEFLVCIDESHLTIPQLRAMAVQDRIRKSTLIDFGFRLPSAFDNRPLTFGEFFSKIPQFVYVSATPGEFEMEQAKNTAQGRKTVAEQLIRPTGLLEPIIEIHSTPNQIDDLLQEIHKAKGKKERVLVIALTKRLAEEISLHLNNQGILTQWLHSEVKTLERPAVLENLRKGTFDVIVGVNLLREGLDLPEVALVAILDADKEGFLRNDTTLIQTMGRAARHLEGRVILYADKVTGSMKSAMEEVQRRRKIQEEYNREHHITPTQIIKAIRAWPFPQKEREVASEFSLVQDVKILKQEMQEAAKNLDFERAAKIRDLIKKLGEQPKQ